MAFLGEARTFQKPIAWLYSTPPRTDEPSTLKSFLRMPVKTIIACSVAGAAAGAAASAAYFSSTGKRQQQTVTESTGIAGPTPQYPLQKQPYPVDPDGLFQYGFPGPLADMRKAPSLTSSFDRRTRNPHWVAEHITPASLADSKGDRKHSYFAEDLSIPEMFRARLHDYFRSGYDRGHQVPAADAKWSQTAMDATFALSNMCPQVGDGFNRDYWAHFEDFCRGLTRTFPSVRIVTGPLYLPARDASDGKYRVKYEVIGNPPNVSVPTHFFKVIYAEEASPGSDPKGKVCLGAFVLPNAEIENHRPLRSFEVPVEIVEKASGLEFASRLPEERRKKLCEQVDCSVEVKSYADRQRSFNKGQFPKKQ